MDGLLAALEAPPAALVSRSAHGRACKHGLRPWWPAGWPDPLPTSVPPPHPLPMSPSLLSWWSWAGQGHGKASQQDDALTVPAQPPHLPHLHHQALRLPAVSTYPREWVEGKGVSYSPHWKDRWAGEWGGCACRGWLSQRGGGKAAYRCALGAHQRSQTVLGGSQWS